MSKLKKHLPLIYTGLLLFYFISATFNQSVRIAGMQEFGHTQLWHMFYLFFGLTCIFAILSRRELGFWWLITIFLWQIPIEMYGAYISIQHGFSDIGQILEPGMNILGLILVIATRHRYLPEANKIEGETLNRK